MPAALLAVLGQAVGAQHAGRVLRDGGGRSGADRGGLVAYLDTVDHLNVVTGAVLALTSLAAALVMIDAAVSFPGALSAGSSDRPRRALHAGARAERRSRWSATPRRGCSGRFEGVHARQLRELLSR